jgi:hypothetical protein
VRERHPSQRLVIATNYEEGSVLPGAGSSSGSPNNLAEDRGSPDLVIRAGLRSSLPEVVAFLRRGRWERQRCRWSISTTTIALSRALPRPHRFRTAVPTREARRS